MSTTDVLDRNKKYAFEDTNETFWKYEFRQVGDVLGWWQYRKRVEDDVFLCVGTITEKEIKQAIKQHKHPLNEDDLIDIELQMKYWTTDEDV